MTYHDTENTIKHPAQQSEELMADTITLEHGEECSRSVLESAVCRRCETPLTWEEFDDDLPQYDPFLTAFCCGLFYEYDEGVVEIKDATTLEPYTPPPEKHNRPSQDPIGQIEEGDECKIPDLEDAICNRCNQALEWDMIGGTSISETPRFIAHCCDRRYTFKVKTIVAKVTPIQPNERDYSPPPESCTFEEPLYPKHDPSESR